MRKWHTRHLFVTFYSDKILANISRFSAISRRVKFYRPIFLNKSVYFMCIVLFMDFSPCPPTNVIPPSCSFERIATKIRNHSRYYTAHTELHTIHPLVSSTCSFALYLFLFLVKNTPYIIYIGVRNKHDFIKTITAYVPFRCEHYVI